MSKRDDRRRALLAPMADHILAHGLAEASLRSLAAAAGTSDRMLLYYFADKDTLLGATLEEIGARLAHALDEAIPADMRLSFAALLDQVWAVAQAPVSARFMALWLDVAARGARGDALFRGVGAAIAEAFADWVAARLDVADPEDRRAQATLLLAAVDGLAMLAAVGHHGDPARALRSLGGKDGELTIP